MQIMKLLVWSALRTNTWFNLYTFYEISNLTNINSSYNSYPVTIPTAANLVRGHRHKYGDAALDHYVQRHLRCGHRVGSSGRLLRVHAGPDCLRPGRTTQGSLGPRPSLLHDEHTVDNRRSVVR